MLSRELSGLDNCNGVARYPIRHLDDLKGISVRASSRNRVRGSQVWDFAATARNFLPLGKI